MKHLYIILLLGISVSISAQQVEKASFGTFLLKNGIVYSHENGLVKSDLLIQGGKIVQLGSNLSSEAAQLIDCKGLEIYPGMIDAGTKLGLAEIGAVSLTQDYNEIGEFTPHMQALTAINPNSVNIPVNRVNGITTVVAMPSGGLFPGTAAAIDLQGYTSEQMYAGFKAPILRFPSSGKKNRWDKRSKEDIKKANKKNFKKLNDFWKNLKVYADLKTRQAKGLDYNPQMDALVDVALGKTPLMIEVNKKTDILKAIAWVNKEKIQSIFCGVAEGYRTIDSLVKYKIPVITGPILANPSRSSDKYDAAYTNAGLMQKAGLQVAIRTNETENVRNLPYNAGFAATYGMGRMEAFRAVTQVPADILGIGDQCGSLEIGKKANLFVTDGDPFETASQVKYLFIKGWNIPLESRHTLLYDEFLEREPGLLEKK